MSYKATEDERKFLLEFIEEYRSLPALWCVSSPEYYNRDMKNEQYAQLVSKYKERFPDAEKKDVIKKINSLRTNFRREVKKFNDSSKSGVRTDEVAEPTLWYFEEMKFLLPHEKTIYSLNNISAVEDDLEGSEGDDMIEESTFPVKRKQTGRDKSQELISLACKRLKEGLSDNDKVASFWASELSKMDENQQIYAKRAINEILYEGQLGALQRNSVQINCSYSSRTSCRSTPYTRILGDKKAEKEFIVEFIEVYRGLPALWDVNNKYYTDRAKKGEQYVVLLEKYREKYPDAEKQDVVKKVNSLRTNFRKVLKRIHDAEKSGAGEVEPSLWYFDEMKFLVKQETVTASISMMDISQEVHANEDRCDTNDIKLVCECDPISMV